VARRLLAVLVGLVLVVVGASPAAADVAVPGADYSWYRPSAAELGGTQLVVRYLVPASWGSGKALSATEARWLLASGHSVGLVWEWSATGALGGYAAGLRDARYAELARREVGAPADVAVYFAVDFDVRPWQVGTVLAYLAGARAELGARVGVYGGYRIVAAALAAGYRYGWQTYAWSYGRWSAARLRQTANGALWHGQGDRDTAAGNLVDDIGAWSPGTLLQPGPGDSLRPVHVPPAPAPAPRWYRVQRGDYLARIAATHGTSWPALARLNHLRNPNRIYPGQWLRLY
jgi:Domain of unknown function (DUF1906)/LysM domain